MSEVVTTVSAVWAPLAAALLGILVLFAASLDGVLSARQDGLPVSRGVARPLDEAARLLRQRRRVPVAADTVLWRVGATGLVLAALLMVAVIPLGEWTLLDLDVGVVWVNAVDVLVWALVWLSGWGPNSVHSLVGGYRFLGQALAYELPLMFALVAPAVAAASLDVGTIAAAQESRWFVVEMPVAFVGYCIGVVAFSVWGPFAAALGHDIAGGVAAELSSVDRLLFEAGRYGLLAGGAAFAVPMFLGGGAGPLLPSWAWVLVKAATLLAMLVWLRRRLPTVRPDLFLEIGWLVLLPLVLAQDLFTAVLSAWRG